MWKSEAKGERERERGLGIEKGEKGKKNYVEQWRREYVLGITKRFVNATRSYNIQIFFLFFYFIYFYFFNSYCNFCLPKKKYKIFAVHQSQSKLIITICISCQLIAHQTKKKNTVHELIKWRRRRRRTIIVEGRWVWGHDYICSNLKWRINNKQRLIYSS